MQVTSVSLFEVLFHPNLIAEGWGPWTIDKLSSRLVANHG